MPVNDEIPESRIMLTYRTTVDGEPRDVNLPFRLLVLGDLSNGTSKDRREREVEVVVEDNNGRPVKKLVSQKIGLDARGLRTLDGGNLGDVMQDMDIKLSMRVPNRIDVHLPQDQRDAVDVNLTLDSMAAFSPKAIAQSVPQLQALLVLKNLLKEVQANLDNRKEFRELLRLINKMEPESREAQIKLLLDTLAKSGDYAQNFKVPSRSDRPPALPPPNTNDPNASTSNA
jgi:type VI secretion system protein ImpB